MFKKFTDLQGNPVYIRAEIISCVGLTATGNTFIGQNGDTQGVMVEETPEEVIKIIED